MYARTSRAPPMKIQVFWSIRRTPSQKRVNRLLIDSPNVAFELIPEYSTSDCANRNGIKWHVRRSGVYCSSVFCGGERGTRAGTCRPARYDRPCVGPPLLLHSADRVDVPPPGLDVGRVFHRLARC